MSPAPDSEVNPDNASDTVNDGRFEASVPFDTDTDEDE